MAVATYGPFNTGFRGTANGAIQTVVTDQPGVGVPGELCFASDNDLVDSYLVTGTDGVFAGAGVQLVANSAGLGQLQLPGQLAQVPNANNLTIADFKGVVVFDENMQSDATGVPGWDDGRTCRVVRPGRAGGRVFVKAVEAVDKATATVNWVTQGGTDGKYRAGEFAPTALAGSAAAGYSVAITTATVISSAAAGGVYAIELG